MPPKKPKAPKEVLPRTKVYFIAPANIHPSEAWKQDRTKKDIYLTIGYAKAGLTQYNKYSPSKATPYAIYEIDLMQAVNKLDQDLEEVKNGVKI